MLHPLRCLRDIVAGLDCVKDKLNVRFSAVMADVSEQSNKYTDISRLPREILLEILSLYAEDFLYNATKAGRPDYQRPIVPRGWVKNMRVYESTSQRNTDVTEAGLSCRSWNHIVTDYAPFWTLIDLSWPVQLIDTHTVLSKDAPLQVFWSDVRSTCAQSEWLSKYTKAITYLHLIWPDFAPWNEEQGVIHDPELLVAKCLTSPSNALRSLDLHVILQERRVARMLPALTVPDLQHLRLQNCWSRELCSARLQTLYVKVNSSIVNIHDIYDILSHTPVLSSCIFHTGDIWDNTAELPLSGAASPRHLPCLHNLELRLFSTPQYDWLYDHIRAELTINDITVLLDSPQTSIKVFTIPRGLEKYTARAETVEFNGHALHYGVKDQFKHSISAVNGHQEAMWGAAGATLASDYRLAIPLFPCVHQLIIADYNCAHHDNWILALQTFSRLSDLRVTGSDTQSAMLDLLIALGKEGPLLCQNLRTLTWCYEGRTAGWRLPGDTAEDTDTESTKHLAQRELEKMLKVRADHGIGLHKLTVSADSWWAEPIDQWKPYVSVVSIVEPDWIG